MSSVSTLAAVRIVVCKDEKVVVCEDTDHGINYFIVYLLILILALFVALSTEFT